MFDLEYIKNEYNEIFDATGKIKIIDKERVVDFCKMLTMITGIQVCNKYGDVYDYIYNVYESALGVLRDGKN